MTAPDLARPPVPVVPADLRLLPAASGSWLGALAGGLLPPVLAWCLAGTVLMSLGWVRRRVSAPRRVLTVGLLMLTAGLTVATVGRMSRTIGPVAEIARQAGIAHVELAIAGDPQHLPIKPHLPPSVLIQAQIRELDTDGRRWLTKQPVLILAPESSWGRLLPSTRVAASVDFRLPTGHDVAAMVVAHRSPVIVRGPSAVQRWAGRIRAGLRKAANGLPTSERGLLPGIVVGDTSLMPDADEADFRGAGLTHLTAVSGANVAVVVAAIFGLLRWTPLGIRMRAMTSGAFLLAFVILARPSPSVLRAGAMGLLALAAIALGRPRILLPALLSTATALVLFKPTLAASPGFTMSVLATLALLVLVPGWTKKIRERLPGRFAWSAPLLAVPIAAQIVCMPVIASISGSVSMAAVPANLLALPAVPVATVIGLMAAVASLVSPGLASALCQVAGVPCRWLIGVARTAAHAPLASVTAPSGFAGLLVVALASGALVAAVKSHGGRRTLTFAGAILAVATVAGIH